MGVSVPECTVCVCVCERVFYVFVHILVCLCARVCVCQNKNTAFALTDSQFLDGGVVALEVVALQVLEMLAAILYHLHQSTIVVAVFSVHLRDCGYFRVCQCKATTAVVYTRVGSCCGRCGGLVYLDVAGHVLDALGEDGNLDLGGARVSWMALKLRHGLSHRVSVLFHLGVEQHGKYGSGK